ncbi:TrkH family potassium uptake protein [Anaeromassilibacillus senegalensis]|uniref:TrkH family potassium uptake protein n=1 Tax=Anaeromassilibacillus senegalensis TaxID=1673717 RepID=A0ABS9CN92_9FIRM|nr:TrkH family potassium uptake protein [Anaeromassilibacillus senegalensis]MCF2652626.1 TrkH family potassium uptake protein [Anaeromassilibacillus senegalensis]
MNVKLLGRITGLTVLLTGMFMLVPMLIAVLDGEDANALSYAGTIALMAAFSALLLFFSRSRDRTFYAQEGFAATGISWIVMSLFGALPFYFSGEIPRYIDALFEIVSGFTTTGASILSNVEALSRCNLYWRSFSHWLGGMGMLVFLLAVVPEARKTAGSGIHLMRAESPGPSVGKLTPHLRQTAMILYGLYILLTALCIVFLLLGGMPVFDSFCIAFGTAGTGGFAIRNSSMGEYSLYLQSVVTVFMLLFGVNFSLYYLLLLRQFKSILKSEELRLYIGIAGGSILLITLNISGMYKSVYEAFHHAAFQVSSIMTTTGFATVDFEQWPAFSKSILFALMFVGACAGSTGGGLKVSRVLLLLKSIRRTIRKALHPRRVQIVRMDGRVVDEETSNNVNAYLAVYCVILLLSFIVISLDGYSIGTNISAVTACFNNIGPGFELVGATGNYGHYSDLSKLVLAADMLLGRLEIFPLLVLLSPDTWSRKR